jgi:hypothetical protein
MSEGGLRKNIIKKPKYIPPGEKKSVENKIPINVICPLCSTILENSKACYHCMKNFCKGCIVACIKHNEICPNCSGFIKQDILLDTQKAVEQEFIHYAKQKLKEYPIYFKNLS